MAATNHGSALGLRFYRNNNGAMKDHTGRLVRFGLRYPGAGGDSLNKSEPSPDFIVAVPIVITPEMVGRQVCVFGGLEIKPEQYPLETKLRNEKTREFGQNKWLNRIISLGGFGGFVRTERDIDIILNDFFKRLTQ